MSGSSGPAGGATFVSPSTPTTGLQRYNLRKPVANLTPDTAPTGNLVTGKKFTIEEKLQRLASRRGDRTKRGSHRTTSGAAASFNKDSSMLPKTIEAMVDALAKSVSDIHAAGGENRDTLLAKSYKEFGDALKTEVEGDLAKRAPTGAEPLFKNLGVVGAVANMVHTMGQHAELLKAAGADELSPEVMELVENSLGYGEAALHQAVNDHCDLAEDADMADGADLGDMHLVQVPSYDDPETYVVLKTALPEDLAKLAVDPASLQERVVELGVSALQLAGVPDVALSKLFADQGEPLTKAFPPPKKKPAAGGSPGQSAAPASEGGPSQDNGGDSGDDSGADVDQGDGTQMGGDQGGDDGSGGAGMDTSGDDPLTVLMRILAAAMIQANHIYEMVNGGGAADAGTDMGGADAGQPSPDPSGMGKRFVVGAEPLRMAPDPRIDQVLEQLTKISGEKDALAKANEDLAKTVVVIGEKLQKVLDTPLPAKGPLFGPVPDGQAADAELMKAFHQLPIEEQTHLLIKAAQRQPQSRFSGG